MTATAVAICGRGDRINLDQLPGNTYWSAAMYALVSKRLALQEDVKSR
jgi:hypothetical protein